MFDKDELSVGIPISQIFGIGMFLVVTLIGSDIVRGLIDTHQFNQCVNAEQQGCVEILKD